MSGVRLSAAPAQPAAAIESPLLREGLQVVPGTSVAARCRHRHALAIEPMVLSADSQPSLLRHGGSPYPRREAPYRPARADNMPADALLDAANLNIADATFRVFAPMLLGVFGVGFQEAGGGATIRGARPPHHFRVRGGSRRESRK